METEAIREFLSAQIHALAKRDDPVRRWIVDDPARKLDFASHLGQDLAQRRFDLAPNVGSFCRHLFFSSFLISVTSRDKAFLRTARS